MSSSAAFLRDRDNEDVEDVQPETVSLYVLGADVLSQSHCSVQMHVYVHSCGTYSATNRANQ